LFVPRVGVCLEQIAETLEDLANLRRVAGPLWQKGFHDHAVRGDEDMRALARYVVANPVRAGLVRSVREYPHWDARWL
jgi:putative transposase